MERQTYIHAALTAHHSGCLFLKATGLLSAWYRLDEDLAAKRQQSVSDFRVGKIGALNLQSFH